MSTQFICSQCRMILSESERRSHISAEHLDYFPIGCPFCKKANKKHLETTKDDMDEHIATYHNGNNLGILLLEDKAKEVELNRMIEQCQDFKQLNGAGTSAGSGNTAQNGSGSAQVKDEIGSDDDIIILEDDTETAAMPNNSSGGILPEQPAQEHIERMAKMEPDEPQEHPASNPIINSENKDSANNDVPNRVPKSEPSVNTSMETNEPTTEQAVTSPITENSPHCENSQAPNPIMPKTERSVKISTTPEPLNFTESYPEMDFSSQSTSGRKRELPDNFSDNDSLESREKRRLVMNDVQLTPALMNGTFSQLNDSIERPTTSSQVTSSVPPDSSCKHVITKLFIVISEGIVCFETIDRCKRDYAPLSQHLPFLLESVISPNHDIAIQFYASDRAIPYQYLKTINEPVKEFTSRDQLRSFADQMHQISFLWAKCLISAYFGQFKKNAKTLSQTDYCTLLFGLERSILKCEGLYVTILENWPLTIVTNVVDKCDNCELYLKEMASANRQLHDAFLDEICTGEVLQQIGDISFYIPIKATVNDFLDKLRKRFQRSPHKRFKFGLCSPSTEVHKLKDQMNDHILVAKSVDKAKKNSCSWVIIEQRAAGS
ncbi:hypothetical protein Ddc_11081 [Ditylenchus destructor]|nr:hypothetical protein Ddc_11081 [Ditylenchus destructor]